MDEIVIPSDQMLPLLESLTSHYIDIESSPEPPSWYPNSTIRKIQIKPLKPKKPEPKPELKPEPVNQNSELDVELLTSVIHISLKKFKKMEEYGFIFSSGTDAEGEALKAKFANVVDFLGIHLKEKIKGRGMEALSKVMDYAAQSNPPRLTMYNHEEECLLTEQVYAAIEEEVKRIAFEEAKRIADEEAEVKRLAEQEALKIAVEMAARIAVVESQKIADEQALVLNQDHDTIMTEQVTTHQASDRGKHIVVDTTPPNSPIRTRRELGTPSSAEIAELQADSKARDEKMDQMLFFLKDLHDRLPPKP
jgi:hypothetical protein